MGLVERHGYPAEEHNITTDDGYNIVFFRIPGSPSSPPTIGKPVVFIQHGLYASSDFFVLMGPKNDLGRVTRKSPNDLRIYKFHVVFNNTEYDNS